MYYPGDKCIKCHFYNAFLDRCECPYDLDFRIECIPKEESKFFYEYVYPVDEPTFISQMDIIEDDLPF